MKCITRNPITTLVIMSAIGMAYLVWFYNIDGIYIRKPLVFKNDPLKLETEQDVYHLGDTVRVKANFCKTRNGYAVVRWALVDGKMTYLPVEEPHELPIGCYPPDGRDSILSDLVKIPNDYTIANHDVHLEGVGTVYLSGGREIKYTYKTKTFRVIP